MRRPDIVSSRTQILSALNAAVSAGVPTILWGNPGQGKTRLVEQVANRQGRTLFTVLGSVREPTDFAGLPIRTEDGMQFMPPRWAIDASKSESALVFLDELSTARPGNQAAMLGVTLDRRVGDLEMPDTVAILAAANPPDVAADGHDLSPPLANRFCHLWFEASPRDWAQGMLDDWAWPLEAAEPGVTPHLGLRQWRATIAAFILSRPNLLGRLPHDAECQGGPWPSPRTWDMAARVGAASDSIEADDDVRLALVSGCVGEGAALELLVYLSELDLPDPEAWLSDTALVTVDHRFDRTLAVAGAVVSRVLDQLTEDRWRAGWEVLGRIAELGQPDTAAAVAQPLASVRQPGWKVPSTVRRFTPLLERAGLA